jgi:pilus assembly protein FimV
VLPPLPDLNLDLGPTPAPAAAKAPASAREPDILDFDLSGAMTSIGRATVPGSRPTPAAAEGRTRMPVPDESMARPTLLGGLTALADGPTRMAPNTDQATVPLIDFDLSAVSLNPTTKRGETEPGSALAQQMATKLDLARGYIDLGVKDGARELLDEVMRDGTRDQRQSAVELIKQIDS